MSSLKTLIRNILVTRNWFEVLICTFLLKKPVLIKFRNGGKLQLNPESWNKYNSFSSFFRHFPNGQVQGSIATINYKSQTLHFDFQDTAPGALAEFFGKNFPYKIKFDTTRIDGRIAVDIGAYLGDSPIWLAVHGAKKVYAFEPLTTYYNLTKKNIAINNLGNVCHVEQAAITGEKNPDFFRSESERKVLGLGKGINDEYKKDVPTFTLKNIIEMHNIQKGAFLKIDCEGYEDEIILNTPNELLGLFDSIMMEYHLGYEKLKEKLERTGFKVQYTKPKRVHQENAGENFKELSVGYIFAVRVN